MAQGRKQQQAVVSTETNSAEFRDRLSNEILKNTAAGVRNACWRNLHTPFTQRPSQAKQRAPNFFGCLFNLLMRGTPTNDVIA
jgi:hypothetical protein